ncbi:MAG: translation initiation factor IF-6 [Methanoregulaceae archaeon]|nr:translation initiation factor IF-6 [Methanoregulaceae archaeon]
MDRTISFGSDDNIGVFSRVFDDIAVVPPTVTEEFREALSGLLDVEVLVTTIQGSEIVGSLLAGNSRGLVVSGLAGEKELSLLREYREVLLLERGMNAAGNIILANDTVTCVHPDLPASVAARVEEMLGNPVTRVSFAGIKTVGMAAVATGRGIMVHPRTTAQELAALESITDLPIGTGSVNMGSGLVGTGLLANSKGYLAGAGTSGYELGRIEDIFGFLER